MEHASWITDIECIYPTLTYPCHATIATGASWTGLASTIMRFQIFLQRDGWTGIGGGRPFRCPTVVDFARQAGLTASTVTWPVIAPQERSTILARSGPRRREDDPTPWFTRANSPCGGGDF